VLRGDEPGKVGPLVGVGLVLAISALPLVVDDHGAGAQVALLQGLQELLVQRLAGIVGCAALLAAGQGTLGPPATEQGLLPPARPGGGQGGGRVHGARRSQRVHVGYEGLVFVGGKIKADAGQPVAAVDGRVALVEQRQVKAGVLAVVASLHEAVLAGPGLDAHAQPALGRLEGETEGRRGKEPVVPAGQGHARQVDGRAACRGKIVHFAGVGLGVKAQEKELARPEEPRAPAQVARVVTPEVVDLRQPARALDLDLVGKALWRAQEAVGLGVPGRARGPEAKLHFLGPLAHLPGLDAYRIIATVNGMDTGEDE